MAPPIFDAVKSRLIALELEVEDKSRSISALKQQLQQTRAAATAAADEHARTTKSQLALQRREYEAAIKRHLAFIDKTQTEKEAVAQRCSALAAQVQQLEAGVKAKLAAVSAAHERDLKQARSVWEAAEKVKRDRWMSAQAAKIKEQTVKGLEPEIQRMLAQHKAAMALAEDRHREAVAAERAAWARTHEQQVAAMRETWAGERARACDEEREAARARYAKQLERDELEFQQQKRKWAAELAEVRDTLQAQFRDERKAADAAHRKAVDELRAAIEEEKDRAAAAADELRRRHAHELATATERMRVEREAWQASYAGRVEADLRERERAFKDALLRERDREIEKIIARVEAESGTSASEVAARHRAEIEQLRATHADELRGVQEQWSVAMDKLVTVGRQNEAAEAAKRELEREIWSLRNAAEVKDKTMADLRRDLDRFRAGEDEVRKSVEAAVRDEMRHRDQLIASLRNELDRVQAQLAGQRRDAEARVAAVQQEKATTLGMIEDRVKKTVAVKEQALADLRAQIEELHVRNGQLELLLERQRKELLMT
ncbi:hypothetical protein H9P43_009919 [Blastocladiella emersonii ATCC 22665]|nr:hypothetical protein H9P43_009919 [Blastocladiella emersonii ATCC 22665]